MLRSRPFAARPCTPGGVNCRRPCAAAAAPSEEAWAAAQSETAKLSQGQLLRRKSAQLEKQLSASQEALRSELRAQEERFSKLEEALARTRAGATLSAEELASLTESLTEAEAAQAAAEERLRTESSQRAARVTLPPLSAPLPPPSAAGFAAPPPWLAGALQWASSAVESMRASPATNSRELDARRLRLKSSLLVRISGLDRGGRATTSDRLDVEQLVAGLAQLSPTASPAQSKIGDGRWNCVYTTSPTLLGAGLPALLRPAGPLYLTFNSEAGRCGLDITWPSRSERGSLAARSRTTLTLSWESARLWGLLPLPLRSGKARDLESVELLYLDIDMKVMRTAGNSLVICILDDAFYNLANERAGGLMALLPSPRR